MTKNFLTGNWRIMMRQVKDKNAQFSIKLYVHSYTCPVRQFEVDRNGVAKLVGTSLIALHLSIFNSTAFARGAPYRRRRYHLHIAPKSCPVVANGRAALHRQYASPRSRGSAQSPNLTSAANLFLLWRSREKGTTRTRRA